MAKAAEVIKFDGGKLQEKLLERGSMVQRVKARIDALEISNPEQREIALGWMKQVKAELKGIEEWREEVVPDLYLAHKLASSGFTKLMAPWKAFIAGINAKVVGFDREVKKRAQEEEARIRREQEEEAAREREAIIAEAQAAEEKGDEELAEEKKAEAEAVSTVVPFVATPQVPAKVEGLQRRATWKARVVDLEALPLEWCRPKVADLAKLNKEARDQKGKNPPPGVEFVEEEKYV